MFMGLVLIVQLFDSSTIFRAGKGPYEHSSFIPVEVGRYRGKLSNIIIIINYFVLYPFRIVRDML